MRACPNCSRQIKDRAELCKWCHAAVQAVTSSTEPTVSPTPLVSSGTTSVVVKVVWALIAVFLVWFGVLMLVMNRTGTAPRTSSSQPSSNGVAAAQAERPAAESTAAPDQLALISASGEWGDGYHIVEGQVRNISGSKLANVTAVTSWYDKDGEFIKADDALIEYDPLLVGQVSPFKTMTRSNPAMTRYRVEFKTLMGPALVTRDDRKQPKSKKR